MPLAIVTIPCDAEGLEIELNDHVNAYQNYIYTKEAGASGESEYVDYGFGEQVDQYNKVAYADKFYEAMIPDKANLYRVQTAYDANYNSDNLYAIAFKPDHKTTKVDAVAPTCEQQGTEEYWTCSVCGHLFLLNQL